MRNRLAGLLPKSTFARRVGMLTGGTAFAQGLAVLALPVLTRLYSPADFSLLAIYTAVIGLVTVASCLRLNIAIPLPEHDEDAMNLLALSLIAALIISIALALAVFLLPTEITGLLRQPNMKPYLWLIPAGVFLASVYNALQYWTVRRKQFGLITRTRITRAVGGAGTQLAIGTAAPGPFGLIFGHMVYGGMGVLGLARKVWQHDRGLFPAVHKTALRQNLYTYRRFPTLSVPEALFNTGGIQFPVLMIAALSAGPEAGFVMLAMRVMGLPMGLVGSSVAQVYLAEAPNRLRAGTLAVFTRRTMWTLLKTGGPALIAAGAAAPFLFPIVFGQDWARAGMIVAWMTPWFVLQFVASPVSVVLHITGHLALAMGLQAFGLLLRVGAVAGAVWMGTGYMVEAFALSGTVFYALYVLVVLVVIKLMGGANGTARQDTHAIMDRERLL
ncbi:MAG: oligosaccharide flippase family protein [Pseudorhodobacter sp.]|nr:oligosaccharide flippase family protein [Pseudorhodobacter sp.]